MEQPLEQSLEHGDAKKKQKPHTTEKREAAKSEEDDNIHSLSGKPFFDVVLTELHVDPCYEMPIPAKKVCLLPPRTKVPIVLRYRGKNWKLCGRANYTSTRFNSGWKIFVADNHLAIGDACVFELKECSDENVEFKVHILRGDSPEYGTVDNPIEVD